MNCWKCAKTIDVEKVLFRTTCPECDADLHTCHGCKYYSPGKPNDCLVPGTEYVRDREAMNFCEDFKVQIQKPKDKNNFNSLFKD